MINSPNPATAATDAAPARTASGMALDHSSLVPRTGASAAERSVISPATATEAATKRGRPPLRLDRATDLVGIGERFPGIGRAVCMCVRYRQAAPNIRRSPVWTWRSSQDHNPGDPSVAEPSGLLVGHPDPRRLPGGELRVDLGGLPDGDRPSAFLDSAH